MTTYFVSRHERAHFWLRSQIARGRVDLTIDRWVSHLDVRTVEPGDLVVGTLPFADVIDLQARGGRFIALTMDLPEAMRGRELSATEMAAYDARLIEVQVSTREQRHISPDRTPGPEVWGDGSDVRIAFVSDQLAPLFLAARQYQARTRHLCLLATEQMRGKANQLKTALKASGIRPGKLEIVKVASIGDDIERLLERVRTELLRLHGLYPESCLVVDLTTGTKPMALALAQAAGEMRARGIPARASYTSTETLHFQWVAPAADADAMVARLTLDEVLALQGRRLVRTACQSDETVRRIEDRAMLSDSLASTLSDVDIGMLNRLASSLDNAIKGNPGARRIEVPREVMQQIGPRRMSRALLGALWRIEQEGLLELPGGQRGVQPERILFANADAVRYLGGGWYEEWIWLKLRSLGAETVALNVEFSDGADVSVINELDVVLIHNNRVLTIEAKTARMDDKKPTTDANQVLYALDSKSQSLAQVLGSRLVVSFRPLPEQALIRAMRTRNLSVLCPAGRDWNSVHALSPDHLQEVVQHWMETGTVADRSNRPTPIKRSD